jgi:hypothetical protein
MMGAEQREAAKPIERRGRSCASPEGLSLRMEASPVTVVYFLDFLGPQGGAGIPIIKIVIPVP